MSSRSTEGTGQKCVSHSTGASCMHVSVNRWFMSASVNLQRDHGKRVASVYKDLIGTGVSLLSVPG